jgi:chromosomal replication initiation ATPase DnaA
MPLKPKFADWLGFQTFGDEKLIVAASAAQEWAYAFKSKESPRWLSFIGKSGTGKTHICKRLWWYAKEKSDWSRFDYFPKVIFWPDFIQTLRSGDAFEMRQEMKRWPVLFLDDIGAERDPTGFAAEELNTLLGCRIDKWTLITSNKDAEGIKAMNDYCTQSATPVSLPEAASKVFIPTGGRRQVRTNPNPGPSNN